MSQWFYLTFLQPLTETYFQKALLGGSLVAVVCGVVGCFVILRRMAFLGDALAHAMLLGIAGGYLAMRLIFDQRAHAPAMLLGALLAALVTVGLIGFVSRVSRIKEDTAIGIMYTGTFALGGVIVSLFSDKIHIDLIHFIMGNVLAVSDADLWVSATVAALVLSVMILFFRQLQLTTFDRVMATSIGVPVLLLDYLLTTCTSLVVVSAVSMVGVILVVGLLITPAATAYLLCDRLSRMLLVSAGFGLLSVVLGLYLSLWMNVAGGSAIILTATILFMIVLAAAPRYGLVAGWLHRRQLIPQEVMEKILLAILRGDGAGVPLSAIGAQVPLGEDRLRSLLQRMQRRDLLLLDGDRVTLTPDGAHEARRILRAHRLWESYLAHVGLKQEELHRTAEALQHVHDEASVDYLDDKLGHPLRDPHGAEIPEDFVHLAPGSTVKASLLREGHRATIENVSRPAPDTLQQGMRIRMGPRQQDDRIWTVELPDGRRVLLEHAQADAVEVKVDASPPPSQRRQ